MRFQLINIVVVIFIILSGCSGSDNPNPLVPAEGIDITQQVNKDADDSAKRYRTLWGFYQFEYDPETNTCDVIPVRNASDHFNLLGFLETWPCTNCVRVIGVETTAWDTLDFTVEIRHPFAAPNFTAFDVRGIAMFEGGFEFPDANFTIPDASMGTGELINADGFTSLYSWWTVSFGPPDWQTYIKGKFATTTTPSAAINGYKRFESPGINNTRRAFFAGDTLTNNFDIDMPDSTFIFGYAVDASWAPPSVTPVTDPITDFPPEANCPEPYKIEVTLDPVGPGLDLGSGTVDLIIDVYDAVPESHDAPVVECPDIMVYPKTAVLEKHYDGYSRYRTFISNISNPSPTEGDFKCLVRVRDSEDPSSEDWLDLTAYAVTEVTVTDSTHGGWARTWGGDITDGAAGVCADLYGNVYVVGYYNGTVDFDPTDGVDEHTSASDSADAYLTKYDSQGNYQWTLTWGGGGTDGANAVATDNNGNIFVVGQWEAGIDLDPDPDEQWLYMTVGNPEGFISKFNYAGDFLWGQKVWGPGAELVRDVACDLVNTAYVTGTYEDNAAFEQNELFHYPAVGGQDAFIARYGADGTFIFGKTLGSEGYDYGDSIATGGADYAVWGGSFSTNDGGAGVDFNPSDTLSDYHYSNGGLDAFVIKYHPSGNYLTGVSFGDIGGDACLGVDVSGSYVYACGYYNGEVDFDPGAGFSIHASNGGYDAWVARYDDEIVYQSAYSWGGTGSDEANGVEVDSFAGLYVAGRFEDTVDFDPGFGTEEYTSAGSIDAYLLKLTTGGAFQWVRTIGSTNTDRATDLSIGEYAYPYMIGTFSETVDFAPPTAASDPHTSSGGSWDVYLIKYLLNGEW